MKEIKPTNLQYFTQIDNVEDIERIYVKSFFGHVDISMWREATKEERDAHVAKIALMESEMYM